MAERAIHYYDCKSGTRLVREWTPTVPANWSVAYFAGKSCYRHSGAVVIEVLVNQCTGKLADIEVKFLVGSTFAANPHVGLHFRRRTNTSVDVEAGNVSILITATGIDIYHTGEDLVTFTLIDNGLHGIVWDAAKLYWFRGRMVGRMCYCKMWEQDQPEPDWQSYGYVVGAGMETCNDNGYFALRVVDDIYLHYFSDIRITPIFRTGGFP